MKYTSDTCVITCYFNPCGYSSRRNNFITFRNGLLKQGVPFFFIEIAPPTGEFEFSDVPGFTGMRSEAVLWQKERLLNVLIQSLPDQYSKICWLDCDILFENDNWLAEVSDALNTFPVIQPYTHAALLSHGSVQFEEDAQVFTSFCAIMGSGAGDLNSGRYYKHGHTGFGWAGRREWMADCGLYDACMSGSGDHLMAHAFVGDWQSPCINRIFGEAAQYRQHYRQWAERAFRHVQGRIAAVQGRILHLWHGEPESRRYVARDRELAEFNFDPATDLVLTAEGCWAFSGSNPLLENWGTRYFRERDEDMPRSKDRKSALGASTGAFAGTGSDFEQVTP